MAPQLINLFEKKVVRFLFFGAITAAFNLLLISLIIESFHIQTVFLKNVANFIAIEISLLFTFWVYRTWVWRIQSFGIRGVFLRELPKFHAAAGLVVLLRTLLIFPVLEWMGISYLANTFIGIVVGSIINYFFSDRLVFRKDNLK